MDREHALHVLLLTSRHAVGVKETPLMSAAFHGLQSRSDSQSLHERNPGVASPLLRRGFKMGRFLLLSKWSIVCRIDPIQLHVSCQHGVEVYKTYQLCPF